MNTTMIDEILSRTLEDVHLSRGERRSLREAFEGLSMDPHDLNHVRNRAFQLALERAACAGDTRLVAWLHDVIKLIDTLRAEPRQQPSCEALFSPGTACLERLVALISATQHVADICVYTITDNRISDVLLDAHRRGVKMRLITEDSKTWDTGSDIEKLESAGVKVEDDHAASLMHHKFAIFDRTTLVTGSYNWTRSAASSNQENLVVTSHEPLVKAFSAEFERLWTAFS